MRRGETSRDRLSRALCALVVVVVVASTRPTRAFYLPGVAPIDYERDDLVYVKVNKLSSAVTQMPYDYYSLPYCKPERVKHAAENLGDVLRGD